MTVGGLLCRIGRHTRRGTVVYSHARERFIVACRRCGERII